MRTNKYILLAATLLGLSSCGNKRGDYDASGTFEATEVIVSSEALSLIHISEPTRH